MSDADDGAVPLETPLDQFGAIIVKARAFDAEVDDGEMEDGSNATDDGEIGALEPVNNPVRAELTAMIGDLNDDALIELVALTLIGRGDFTATEFAEAKEAAGEITDQDLVKWLVETPILGDLIDQGLAELGYTAFGEE